MKLSRIVLYAAIIFLIILSSFLIWGVFSPQTRTRFAVVLLENKNGPPDAIVATEREVYDYAKSSVKSGDYKRAEACYKALIKNYQENPSLHFQLANLYEFDLHLFEAAIKEYRLAEETSGNNIKGKAFCQELIGGIYLNDLALPKKAIIAFQESLQYNHDNIRNPRLLYNLAVALCSVDRKEEGKDYFRKTIQLQPDAGYAYVSRAQLLVFEKDYKGALRELTKAKEINSDEVLKEVIDRAIEALKSAMQE